MVLSLSHVERALQIGLALGIVFNRWDADVLHEINGLIAMILLLYAENDAEHVFRSRPSP